MTVDQCPICRADADIGPAEARAQACSCGSCGQFVLSDDAANLIDTQAEPFNRERLSEAVRDLGRAAPQAPRIDFARMTDLLVLAKI